MSDKLKAPFPYFGGKSRAAEVVWSVFGDIKNYVEPFCGSAAMLLCAPEGKRIQTINDADGFVANFWRAISKDPHTVADYADWPVNENDLFARHAWLVNQTRSLTDKLHGDPDWYDPKIAGWWCWGCCNWIGSGWCSGLGPWVHNGETIVRGNAGRGINRQLPHLGDAGRSDFIHRWFSDLYDVLRDTRVASGDWTRVVKYSVTTQHGLTGLFLDPPYTKGKMDYAVQSTGGPLTMQVQQWCAENGGNPLLRIVLCGHAGEHDALLNRGWSLRTWTARKGYAATDEAVQNSKSETLWCSPRCVSDQTTIPDDLPDWLK